MTETNPSTQQNPSANSGLDELIPAIGFVATYVLVRNVFSGDGPWSADTAIYWATAITISLSMGLVLWKKLSGKTVSPVLWFITIMVTFSGIFVIGLQKDAAVYMKPTLVNSVFASLLAGGLAFGFNPIKYLSGGSLPLPDSAWFWMSVRWVGFFLAMAIWNEYLWRTYCPLPVDAFSVLGLVLAPNAPYSFMGFEFGLKDAEGVWAGWKLGNVGVTFVFLIINAIFLWPHLKAHAETNKTEISTK